MANLTDVEKLKYWDVIQKRNHLYDGIIYYAVKTTGIYCKPSCPSRRPAFQSVVFFSSNSDAEQAGFRACKRCKPERDQLLENSGEIFSRAQKILDESSDSIPTVAHWAERTGVSAARLRSVLKEIAGVTPREFLMNRKVALFKNRIRSGENVTSALYSAGFGSSSRLYEKAADRLGMTPGRFKNGGKGELIRFTVMNTPLGKLLLAATNKGLCSVMFGNSEDELIKNLKYEFPEGDIAADEDGLNSWVELLRQYFSGETLPNNVPLDLRTTVFRQKVWEAIRNIPIGETRSYSQVAQAIGQPSAVRAVASACAANPVALITPCHRVIHNDGSISGYRWGLERKAALLEMERMNTPLINKMESQKKL